MFINKQGEIIENLPENGYVPMPYYATTVKKYRVRVIHDIFRKSVVLEEDFDSEPDEAQITYCIMKAEMIHLINHESLFATVEEIWVINDNALPFD